MRQAADDYFAKNLLALQLGCGAVGGSQIAAALVQLGAHNDHAFALIARDLINAFNTISRVRILEQLFALPQFNHIWRMVFWLLGSPSTLLVMDGDQVVAKLVSATGVRQGCSLGPFCFSIGIHEVLLAAQALTASAFPNEFACITAILDNICIIGTPAGAAHLAEAVGTELAVRGDLRWKPKEEKLVYLPDGPLPPALSSFVAAHAAKFGTANGSLEVLRRTDTTRVLGCIIGGDANAVRHALLNLFNKDHAQVLRCLVDEKLLSTQNTLLLTRLVVAGYATHMFRIMPPALTDLVAERVDGIVTTILADRLGVAPAHGFAFQQCLQPIRLGGIGLPRATTSAPQAFVSGCAQIAYLLSSSHRDLANTPWFTAALSDALSRPSVSCARDAPNGEGPHLLPASTAAADFVNFFATPIRPRHQRGPRAEGDAPKPKAEELQRNIAYVAHKHALDQLLLLERPNSHLRRRLEEARGPFASSFLTALPTSQVFTVLDDATMRASVRLRIGMPPLDNMPDRCLCAASPRLSDAPTHMVSCSEFMHLSGASIARHQLIASAIAFHFKAAGLLPHHEARGLDPNRDSRPDLLVQDASGAIFLTDHTVIDPLAGSASVDSTLRARAAAKRSKYSAMALAHNALFVPLVFCTLGATDRDTCKFLRLGSTVHSEVAAAAWDGGLGAIITAMANAVSCALAKGNAFICINGAHHARLRLQQLRGSVLAALPVVPSRPGPQQAPAAVAAPAAPVAAASAAPAGTGVSPSPAAQSAVAASPLAPAAPRPAPAAPTALRAGGTTLLAPPG